LSTYFLSAPVRPGSGPSRTQIPIPKFTLESMNGLHRIPLDGSSGWIRMKGATGFEMPPMEIISEALPGVFGAAFKEVRVLPRPVFIPIYCGSDIGSQLDYLSMKDELRRLVDPQSGTFRIIGRTARSERELIVTYTGGLEGADGGDEQGLSWAKFGLNAVALEQPFAQARADQSIEFQLGDTTPPFMGVEGGTDAPWPGTMTPSSIIGEDMHIIVNSEVAVHATLELFGPMESFEASMSPVIINPDGSTTLLNDREWFIDIPAGVPAGQLFRMVTDPLRKSTRLNGNYAAGRISLGSTVRPIFPGRNVLNVLASGGNDDTRVKITWRELYRSLW
jgi:hypothetical protein